jgi:PAS domain S-box-containing protein
MRLIIRSYILLIILIVICSYLIFQANEEIAKNTIEKENNEQLIHAFQAEKSLINLFDNYNSSLFFLADNEQIVNQSHEGDAILKNFFMTHQSEISSITRVNNQGVVISSYPNESIKGVNISGQEHVREILQTHAKVISDVFTAVQGYRAVAVHVPVFSGTEFRGSIALLIPFDALAKKYLEKIRPTNSGYAWAVSNGGIVLYSPYSGQTGRSVSEIFTDFTSVLAFIHETKTKPEGIGTYLYHPPDLPGDELLKYHAVYRQIDIGDQSWFIIVAAPEKEIFSSLQTFTQDLLVLSAVIFVSILFFSYFSARAMGIIREEKKRKQVESALRESEKNYRMIFESIQDVFFRSDSSGRLTMMSPSGVVLLGYDSTGEVLGKNLAEILFPSPQEYRSLKSALDKSGSVKNYELVVQTKGGGKIYAWTSSHWHYNESGEIDGIEGIIHDITNERMTSNALGQALKKLTLLNSVTFSDIQSSIFSLGGYIEISKGMTTQPDLLGIVEREDTIIKTIFKSLNFVKDYQGLGMNPPSWQSVQQAFLFGISHTDISPYTRTMQMEKVEVFADPLLEKVFFILAENVLHHGKKTTAVSLNYTITENGMIISFADNGVGIPESEKKKIFEWVSGNQRKNGLFLAREILGITGITIQENGVPGEGARFEMTIPHGSFRFADR